MKNYTDSDYALNKFSKSIVYRFADKIVEITLEDYLAENPCKSEADFLILKKQSDAIYFKQARKEDTQTKKNVPLEENTEVICRYVKSPEQTFIDDINARTESEDRQKHLDVVNRALDKLTEVQRRRYLLHVVKGLSTWQIAEKEGTNQKSVYESIQASKKKIKNFIGKKK